MQITRQRYRGRRWHVVHDPASNQFFRLGPVAHELVSLLDGNRTVEQAWETVLTRHGDDAPTQHETIQIISQMHSSNLLKLDASPDTAQMLRRGADRKKRKAGQQALSVMYLRFRLFNPDPLLSVLEPVARPLLSRAGLVLWCALMVYAGYALASTPDAWGRLVNGFDDALAPSNWGWIAVVFIVTKALHELGHGLLCKRFGGQVPEMGAMLLVLFPAPYVDASASWAFESKWKRIAVGAGGMLVELALAAGAALVWASQVASGSEGLARQLAYNVMLTASVSTLLFNANPLMRFDGYYILSDLVEVPNLASRANKQLLAICQRYLYRLRDVQPVTDDAGERAVLVVYGLCALAYRIFLFITITLFVLGKLFALGLILAVWTAGAWFLVPLGKMVHWLSTNAVHRDRRGVSWGVTAGWVAALVGLVALVPMPDHRSAGGVVEPAARSNVFVRSPGFVEEVAVRLGDRVEAGDVIARLTNNELVAQRDALRSSIEELAVLERRAREEGRVSAQLAGEQRIEAARRQMASLDRRIEDLTVRAPHPGVISGEDPRRLLGVFAEPGARLCELVDDSSVRVAASLAQAQAGWIHGEEGAGVRAVVRAYGSPHDPVECPRVRVYEAGSRALPSAALSVRGGGTVEVDTRDESGLVARAPRFTVVVEPGEGVEPGWSVGERARVRFTLPPKPLASQWLDRLLRAVRGRVEL